MSGRDDGGWLIERADSSPAEPWYWAAGQRDAERSSAWTQNHMEAIRFARRDDAEKVARRLFKNIAVRVCSHEWSVGAAKSEAIRLIREEFDPTPPNGDFADWYDNAEEVAEKIIAVVAAQMPAHVGEAWAVVQQWLRGFADEESSFSRYADDVLIDGVMTAATARALATMLAERSKP